MKTYLKKHHIHLSAMSLLLLIMTMVGGCADDLLYDPNDWSGDGTISMTLGFEPMYASDLNTRTPGNVIKKLNSLSLVFFDTNGTFVKIINQGDPEIVGDSHRWDLDNETDDNTFDDKTEEHTPKVTFKLQDIPFGKYHIYAVANMGNLTAADVKSTDPNITDEKKLKGTVLEWNEGNVAANAQMFGYFSTNNSRPGDFDAPEIVITKDTPKLYAWVRRAASKVTIAYDASKLRDNVRVYINKVTIRDIPKTCLLGETNKPQSPNDLIPDGGTLYYGSNGIVPADQASDNYEQWLTLTNKDKEPLGTDHSETAQALFFYENMQGDFKDDANKEKYDKRKEASPKHGVLVNPGDPDYKDEVPYGTYIEVEAYYNSQNPANITSGKIIYRFMLGKDVEYNYNAERNHHFKLTLCFNGWANQADWHIEYTEEDPSIQTDPYFYMPYLYNQKAMFPMKLNGKVKSLKVEILENGWAPVSRDTHQVPPQKVGDEFQWNLPAYERFGPKEYACLGFLALAVPNATGQPAKNVVDLNFSEQQKAVDQLEALYTETRVAHEESGDYTWSQKERYYDVSEGTHQDGNNGYTITPADEGDAIAVQIPLWTRNKTMISNSGYSGNNPYEAYERLAVIKITAVFHVSSEPNGEKELTKEVPIYQVRRIVNPKAIWRSYSDSDDFLVHLMTMNSPTDSEYIPLQSKGTWAATIESGAMDFCYLTNEAGEKMTVVEGDTDSEIKFYVKFNGTLTSGVSKGCVINIDYNGVSCTHKILVRQGYDTPVAIVGNSPLWSSFNLFSCQSGRDNSSIPAVSAELTKNPLSVGSLFKRRNYTNGILVINNDTYGPLVPVNGNALKIAQKNADGTWQENTWNSIVAYRTDNNDTGYPWATFTAIPQGGTEQKTYRVPTYEEYRALDNAEYAVGIVYADGARSTQTQFDNAYGFEDGNNTTLRTHKGIRGFVVYNRTTGNQVLFPLGKYGMARRTQFNIGGNGLTNPNRGYLRYGDVPNPLTQAENTNNIWRPIPYNLPLCPGSIYWINVPKLNGHEDGVNPCGGWDMNYFSLDFSAYTYNNRNDACPVKLVLDE